MGASAPMALGKSGAYVDDAVAYAKHSHRILLIDEQELISHNCKQAINDPTLNA